MTDKFPEVNSHTMDSVMLLVRFGDMGRELLERILLDSNIKSTGGVCLHSALLMSAIINTYSDFTARVVGGDGLNDGGYTDANGDKHGHYWCEVSTPGGIFILDLSSDQFPGGHKVEICLLDEPPACHYEKGDQRLVDEHVAMLDAELRHAAAPAGSTLQ